jgi:hypothetical protein
MNCVRWFLGAAVSLCFFGCAQVPPQTVELSATMGRDFQELQRSHRKAINLLHDRDLERVNRYIEQVVIPTYVKTVIDSMGPRLSEDLSKAIGTEASQENKNRVFEEMRKTVLGISARVEKQRQEMVAPIEEARKARLHEVDMAYAQLQEANAVLKAHLASVVKVQSVQDDLMGKAGLKDFREKVGDSALDLSKQVDEALNTAKDVSEAVSRMKAIFEKVNK